MRFAAERPGGTRYRSPAAGAVQQAPPLSSTCGQRHVDSRRRRLDADFVRYAMVVHGARSVDACLYRINLRRITTFQDGAWRGCGVGVVFLVSGRRLALVGHHRHAVDVTTVIHCR